jgi:hypothetical protein
MSTGTSSWDPHDGHIGGRRFMAASLDVQEDVRSVAGMNVHVFLTLAGIQG